MRLARLSALSALALAFLAAPLFAEAQPAGKVIRLGLLYGGSPAFRPESDPYDKAFVDGLRENGYVVGQNIVIEFRSAFGRPDRLPGLAAELVSLPVDLIAAVSTRGALAAKQATSTVPIVMMGASDVVQLGLVASLGRPGGNVTGLTNNSGGGLDSKQLELLKEAAPKVSRVAVIWSSANPPEVLAYRTLEATGRTLGLSIVSAEATGPDDLESAFNTVTREHSDALFVFPSPLNFQFAKRIADFATRTRLPAMFGAREFVDAGGLMSYMTNWNDLARRGAYYVAKILKGAKPADLPVEQPTKFELVINLKTAKALGLTIPPSVLARADEVIQ
jgi:putative ABC transport system substrate-binding protein